MFLSARDKITATMQQTIKQNRGVLKTHSEPVIRNLPTKEDETSKSHPAKDERNGEIDVSKLLQGFDKEYEENYFPKTREKHFYMDPRKTYSEENNNVCEDRLQEMKKLEKQTVSEERRDSLCKNYNKRKAKTTKVVQQTIRQPRGISKTQSEPVLRNLPDLKLKIKEKTISLHSKLEKEELFRIKTKRKDQSDSRYRINHQPDSRKLKANHAIDEESFFKQLSETERKLFRVKVSEGRDFSSYHTDGVIIPKKPRAKSACVENRYKASTFYKPNQDKTRLQTPVPPPRRSSLDLPRTKSFSKYKPEAEDIEKLRLVPSQRKSQSGVTDNIPIDQLDCTAKNLIQSDSSSEIKDQSKSTIPKIEDLKPRKILLKRTNVPLKFYMQFVTKGPGKVAVR